MGKGSGAVCLNSPVCPAQNYFKTPKFRPFDDNSMKSLWKVGSNVRTMSVPTMSGIKVPSRPFSLNIGKLFSIITRIDFSLTIVTVHRLTALVFLNDIFPGG